jgi:succinate dehydrogenase / fumarate reductase flavoprotein subunit
VDYNLMSNLPGLFVLGEANFSDHGANRLGASALMQGLADGYFVIPYTLGGFLAEEGPSDVATYHTAFAESEKEAIDRIKRMLSNKGKRTVDHIHRELGLLMWNNCGMSRNEKDLQFALGKIPEIREEFWGNVTVTGTPGELNQVLERAGRVADYLEFAELLVTDALGRKESCGGHFREESQTEDNEAKRDDENFSYVAAWEHKGAGQEAALHKEPLVFENVQPTTRSYK